MNGLFRKLPPPQRHQHLLRRRPSNNIKSKTTSTTIIPQVVQFWLLLQTAVVSLWWSSQQLGVLETSTTTAVSSCNDDHSSIDPSSLVQTTASSSSVLLDYDLVKKYPLTRLACGHESKFPIVMHISPGYQWVCGNNNNGNEHAVTQVMLYIFHKHQQQQQQAKSRRQQQQQQQVMLDVGANAGYYSLLAAIHFGHQAVQFDVLPECQRLLRNNVILNGVQHRVTTVSAGISSSSSANSMPVPDDECNGRFPIVAYETQSMSNYTTRVPLRPLTDFVQPQQQNNNVNSIMLVKIDVEGNEQRVLESAMDLFASHTIRNAIVEVTPGYNFWKHQNITKQSVYDTLGQILDEHGYTCISLDNWVVHRSKAKIVQYLEHFNKDQVDLWLTIDNDIVAATRHSVLLNKTMLDIFPSKATTSNINALAAHHHHQYALMSLNAVGTKPRPTRQ